MRHQRLRNILAAGTLTGLVLLTMLAFAWPSISAQSTTGDQTQASEISGEDTLRAENEQLRQAIDVLQQREAAYQSQIETANQTILQLQAADNPSISGDDWDEHDEYEEHEDEHEHEEEEHEYEWEHDDD